jgi:hypothetical protein
LFLYSHSARLKARPVVRNGRRSPGRCVIANLPKL